MVLLFWLTITFVSYGLVAARNSTVVIVLFFCAVSVGSALFLILEMDGPFVGMLKVSADPMHFALAHLNLNNDANDPVETSLESHGEYQTDDVQARS